MANTPKSTTKPGNLADGVFSAFPTAFMANLPASPMNGSASWWQAYMTSAAEMNREFMSFLATRLQQDAELGQSLAKCSDWADAASVHQDWIRTMSEQYVAEAETLMQIVSNAAEQGLAAASGDADDDVESAGKSKKQ